MFKLEECVAYIATNAAKNLAKVFAELLEKNHNISRVQWIALYYIGNYEEINQKKLSKLMKTKESSTARLIDRMEKEGYLIRKISKNDRRNVILELTEKGNVLYKESLPCAVQYRDIVSKDISNEELIIFLKVLKKMRDNVKDC